MMNMGKEKAYGAGTLSAMALLVLLRALSSARAFSINISRSSCTSSESPSSYIKIYALSNKFVDIKLI